MMNMYYSNSISDLNGSPPPYGSGRSASSICNIIAPIVEEKNPDENPENEDPKTSLLDDFQLINRCEVGWTWINPCFLDWKRSGSPFPNQ